MRLRQETGLTSAKAVPTSQLEVVKQTEGSSRAVGGIFVFVEPAFALSPGHDGVAHRTVDVVVVGAGGAGLTAAITAKEAGVKNVVVLEKMAFAGGNTVRAGGGFNAAIKADYEKAGIKDSPELHASQTLAAGDYRGNPEIVKKLTALAPESVQWLKDHGVKF